MLEVPLKNDFEYDVIIPVAKRECTFVPRVIKYIRKNLIGAQIIYLLTDKKNIHYLDSCINGKDCVFVDEDKLIDGLTLEIIGSYLKAKGSYDKQGWFMQQFLKMGFALSPLCGDYYLSWDADTLPLSHIRFWNDGHPLFTKKKEYYPSYFKTIQRLLGLNKIEHYSFIAEHMLFKRTVMKDLVNKIGGSSVEGNNWMQKIINACDFENKLEPQFSEFETYGTFCSYYYPELYKVRQLNTFRRAGLIKGRNISDKLLENLSFDLDIASFEFSDIPFFDVNIRHFWYRIQRRLVYFHR